MGLVEGAIAVAAGVSALLSFVLRPKVPGSPIIDTTPTAVSLRGESWVPVLFGRARIDPVFAWAGGRVTREEGGGGGGKGQPETPGTTVYFESGMHLLCVGSAWGIIRVWENGTTVLDSADAIYRADYPSGSNIALSGVGNFDIYWGENDQPLSDFLADPARLGVASRWPRICYIAWREKRLGTSAVWPRLQFEVEARPCAPLSDSPAWINSNGSVGANPAHCLYQLLAGDPPYGCAIPESNIDTGSFEAVGVIANTEGWAVNYLAANGDEALKHVAAFLQECGYALVQVGDKLALSAIRRVPVSAVPDAVVSASSTVVRLAPSATNTAGALVGHMLLISSGPGAGQTRRISAYSAARDATVSPALSVVPTSQSTYKVVAAPVLTEDMVSGSPPDLEWSIADRVDRVIFTYASAANKYRNGDIGTFAADARGAGAPGRVRRRQIVTATDQRVAYRVARLLYAADLQERVAAPISVLRDAERIYPGAAFFANFGDPSDPQYRLMRAVSVERASGGVGAKIDAVLDLYALSDPTFLPVVPVVPPPSVPGPDSAFAPFEVPAEYAPSEIRVGVARHRSSTARSGASVFYSPDGTSYVSVGAQNSPSGGGELDRAYNSVYGYPVVRFVVDDLPERDVSRFASALSRALWLGGERLMLVRGRLYAFDRVSPVAPGIWMVLGVLPWAADDAPVDAPVSERVYLFTRQEMASVAHPLMVAGSVARIKSVPVTIDPGEVVAQNLSLRGRVFGQPQSANFEATSPSLYTAVSGSIPIGRVRERLNRYVSGETITFAWNHRNAAAANAAGALAFGSAVSADTGDSSGGWRLDLLADPPVSVLGSKSVSAVSAASSASVTLSSAERASILGSANPAAFTARLVSLKGAFESTAAELRVSIL